MMRNISEEELGEIIANFNFLPTRHTLVITLNQFKPEDSELEFTGETDEMLDDWQYVIAAGTGTEYKAGDKILLDMQSMSKRVTDPHDNTRYIDQVDIKPVEINGEIFTIISDRYVLGKEFEFAKGIDIKA